MLHTPYILGQYWPCVADDIDIGSTSRRSMGFSSHLGTGMVCSKPIPVVPSKLEALKQCQSKVGPASQTVGQLKGTGPG